MKERIKKAIYLILPVIIMAVVLFASNRHIDRYYDILYENAFEAKVASIDMFSNEVEHAITEGFAFSDHEDLLRLFIINQVEDMDSEFGVFATALDKDKNVIAKRSFKDNGQLDPMDNEVFTKAIFAAMEKDDRGYVNVEWKGFEQVYFMSIPTEDTQYWIVVGVVKDLLVKRNNIGVIETPITIGGILVILISETAILSSLDWTPRKKKEEGGDKDAEEVE